MLKLILQENSFQFNLKTHDTAMRTKVAVEFADIFMYKAESEIISKSTIIPLEWKRYIDHVFSRWDAGMEAINQFKPTGIIQS